LQDDYVPYVGACIAIIVAETLLEAQVAKSAMIMRFTAPAVGAVISLKKPTIA